MNTIRWVIDGLAVGHKPHQQVKVEIGFDTEPTMHNVEEAKVKIEKALWKTFPIVFYADPARVETHIRPVSPEGVE